MSEYDANARRPVHSAYPGQRNSGTCSDSSSTHAYPNDYLRPYAYSNT